MPVPKITFYIPKSLWPQSLPLNADKNWAGFGLGIYTWTIQTYLRLSAIGFPCELANTLPEEGIVLFHSNANRRPEPSLKPNPRRVLICIKAESTPHPYAQLHVVQNPVEANNLDHSYYLPHWPQPGLLPRDLARKNRLENVVFLGHANNLAPELLTSEWTECLDNLGLCWQPRLNHNTWKDQSLLIPHWHDYRQVDAIVAIRSFDPTAYQRTQQYQNKPATKLYNAWLAGVPAILGPESAFRNLRQQSLDYQEVGSLKEVLESLQQLQHSQDLYSQMIQHGFQRAKDYTPERIVQQWKIFFKTVAIPYYDQWCSHVHGMQHWKVLQAQSQSYRVRMGNRLRTLVYR